MYPESNLYVVSIQGGGGEGGEFPYKKVGDARLSVFRLDFHQSLSNQVY